MNARCSSKRAATTTSTISPTDGRFSFRFATPSTGAISRKTSNLTQWVFVYRVDCGAPKVVQRISIPNAFVGLAWAPDGSRFYVSGGVDDRVLVYARRGGSFVFDAPAVLLGHDSHGSAAQPDYDGGLLSKTRAGGSRAKALSIVYGAIAAGLVVSRDGRTLAVANMQNDSVSFVDMTKRKVTAEVALYAPGGREAQRRIPLRGRDGFFFERCGRNDVRKLAARRRHRGGARRTGRALHRYRWSTERAGAFD